MKTIEELEEDIYKCSKCGLCQKVCPIYKVTGNECTLSRGKFTLLNGVLHKHIELNADVKKYLDICLNCNACKKFCPSNIDATEILTNVKAYNERNSIIPLYLLIKTGLLCIGLAVRTYKLLCIDKLIRRFSNTFAKLGKLGRALLIFNSVTGLEIKRTKTKTKKSKKIIYFPGCVNKYINKSENNAVLNLLEDMGYNVIIPKFECCGMSLLLCGKFKQFKNLAIHNLAQLPDEFGYVVTDCASCASMLKEYCKYLPDKYKQKAEKLSKSVINPVELLKQNKKLLKNEHSKHFTITWHQPCHFEGEINQVLESIENISFVKMKEYDSCCGAAGSFILKYPDISKKISTEKAKNIIATNSDIVVTSCPACVAGLKHGLIDQGNTKTKVMNLSEFLEFIKK